MVSCAARNDACCFFFIVKLADLEICASQLEAAGDLKVLGLQIYHIAVAEVRRIYKVCLSGHILECE